MKFITAKAPHTKDILEYFTPRFMLGMTATPDRTDRKDILSFLIIIKFLKSLSKKLSKKDT